MQRFNTSLVGDKDCMLTLGAVAFSTWDLDGE